MHIETYPALQSKDCRTDFVFIYLKIDFYSLKLDLNPNKFRTSTAVRSNRNTIIVQERSSKIFVFSPDFTFSFFLMKFF